MVTLSTTIPQILSILQSDPFRRFSKPIFSPISRNLRFYQPNLYVERRQFVNDGRVKKVFVTDKAREFQPVLFSFLEEWTDTLFQGFSTEERELALRFLHRIAKTASKIRMGEGDIS